MTSSKLVALIIFREKCNVHVYRRIYMASIDFLSWMMWMM